VCERQRAVYSKAKLFQVLGVIHTTQKLRGAGNGRGKKNG
jgi:hypothetical protein